MNIALGAVLIFILLIPPIAFYVSYTSGRHARAGLKFSFLDGLLASAIFSLFIHSIAIYLIHKEVRFDILLKLAGGELKDLENKISNEEFGKSIRQFAGYNIIILIIMLALGQILRFLSDRNGWHGSFELLRIRNKWWYLFNGHFLSGDDVAFDNPFVDAVVDIGGGSVIYSGYLVEFVCNGEELDRIYLRNAVRREFKKESVNKDSPAIDGDANDNSKIKDDMKDIPGQFLCIEYSKIINLNLRFLTVENISLKDLQEIADSVPESGTNEDSA